MASQAGGRLRSRLDAVWYGGRRPGLGLRALAGCYALTAALSALINKALASHPGVPVIVVGNLAVGGTGKTPLVIRLLEVLAGAGFRPGVVSRGYRSRAGAGPVFVSPGSSAREVGDEPLLIHRRSGVPVAVGSRRARAAKALRERHPVDVIVSDDGLQHYRLERDLEIAVIDGERGLGNGRLLPAGPLRERPNRLESVDYVVVNGGPCQPGSVPMSMELASPVSLSAGRPREFAKFGPDPVIAMAGIGHPERFFAQLEDRGLRLERRPFPDHHEYRAADLDGCAGREVMVTEKDAVKLAAHAGDNFWSVPANARLPAGFERALVSRVAELKRGNHPT